MSDLISNLYEYKIISPCRNKNGLYPIIDPHQYLTVFHLSHSLWIQVFIIIYRFDNIPQLIYAIAQKFCSFRNQIFYCRCYNFDH